MKTIDKILFGFGIFIFIKLSYILLSSPSYNLSDITPYSILLSALIAAIAMYMSTKVNIILDNKNKQFEFMMNLCNFYYAHEGIRSIGFAIEYDNFTYESAKHGSDNEKYLFALLRYFENMCSMYNNKLISHKEIEPIFYNMKRVYSKDEVQKFLQYVWLKHENYNTKAPYHNYLEFCQKTFK